MIAIELGNRTFGLPENWTEIVQNNLFEKVAEVNATCTTREQAQLVLVELLSGMNAYAVAKAFGAATPEQRNALAQNISHQVAAQMMEEVFPCIDFIFNEPCTINPLPELLHKGIRYQGPDEKLQSQTGYEMEECAWAYAEYTKTGDVKYLNRLVATLYRPCRFIWLGKAKAYNPGETDANEKRLASLSLKTKLSILFFYQMCEAWWAKEYAFLYDTEPDTEKANDKVDSLSVSRLIRGMAGGKRGTINDVRAMQRHEIYFELAEQWREMNDRK